MREIGQLPDRESAQTFSDYLLTREIATEVREERSGRYTLWAISEDALDQAKQEYQQFLRDPHADLYVQSTTQAKTIRNQQQKIEKQRLKAYRDASERWAGSFTSRCPVGFAILLTCTTFFVLLKFGGVAGLKLQNQLGIATIVDLQAPAGQSPYLPLTLDEVRGGQVWRLVTPIFLHRAVLHFAFNMVWLYLFATMIEPRRNSLRFLAVILMTGLAGNLTQLFFDPGFLIGFSGSVYGLFGYAWMKHEFEPEQNIHVTQRMVLIFLVWMMLGFTGILDTLTSGLIGGRIANFAHLGGLMAGVLLGLIGPLRNSIAWRKSR